MKKTITLPCWIGDKVKCKPLDYVFTINDINFYKDNVVLFRCGNPGTNDYTAFYLTELGSRYELVD